MLAMLALATALSGGEIRDLVLSPTAEGLAVSLRLEGAFPPEIDGRLDAGIELSFTYTVRLRRRRGGFVDKTMSERYVVVTAQYSHLTKMFKLTRRVDGTVTDFDLTDDVDLMKAWMTRIDRLVLFEGRDLADPGSYYVRTKASLLTRFRLLFVPWDLETGWVEAEGIVVPPARR